MANIKSAKKRIITSAKRAERNKAQRSAVKTAIKIVRTAVEANDKEKAEQELRSAVSIISEAGRKGLYHHANASRKVSRLTKAVNGIQAE